MRTSFFTVVPPFVISYLIYHAAEKEHERLMRTSFFTVVPPFVISYLIYDAA